MPARVLDSWALIAFFEDEPSAVAVEEILNQAVLSGQPLYLSVLNWAEIYYNTMREASREHAEARVREIETLPIEIVEVAADLKLARAAAQLKARFKISLADAFAAALAREKKAELVTGDGEFAALEKEIKVAWLASA